MNRNDAPLALLRTLDAAPARGHQDLSARACADLEEILASGPTTAAAATPAPDRPHGRRARGGRGVRTLISVGAVATVAAAAVVVLPSVTGGDEAFATWTPTARTLSAAEGDEAADQCRSSLDGGAGQGFETELAAATAVVSDRRGAWTTVLLAGDRGFTALCVTDESARLFGDQFGSIGIPEGYQEPRSDEVIATDLGTGTIDAGALSLAAGHAGTDITGISYDSPTHGTVDGTVSRGHFVLWLPGGDFEDASRLGVDVTLAHTDGTTSVARLRLP
jgi:hypothetical protein